MNKYDYRTKTRALFALSVGFIEGHDVSLEEDFFITVCDFCNIKLKQDIKKYIDYVNLVLYLKVENHKLNVIENEKTIKSLYDILDDIKSTQSLLDLYNEIKQEDIDRISELASEYVDYLSYLDRPTSTPFLQ